MSGRGVSLCLLVALVGGCAARGQRGEGKQGDEISFSHAKHVEQGAACTTCHKGVEGTDTLAGRHGPTMKDCAECHSEATDKAKCGLCHRDATRAKAGQSWRPPTEKLRFSHRTHAKRAKDCLGCHAGAAIATTLPAITPPKMRGDCFGCHNHLKDYRELRCNGCHQTLSRYPIASVSSFNHEGNFLRQHGRWARAQSDVCASCHNQSYCAECHSERSTVLPGVKQAERVDRQFIHRGDWLGRHPIESRAAPSSCARCHGTKSCDRCHQAQGISAAASGTGRSPHPPDWLNPGSPNNHGGEARRHIAQCAGCHDRGAMSNCVRCHRSASKGGLGLRPHPPGWNRGGKSSNPMCLICH
jgi:hypothetical protein